MHNLLLILLDVLLSGTPIGSTPSVDYNTSAASTTVNLPADAFDGNMQTYYASYDRSYTWVGLDLGTPHVITRVGWSPRNDGVGPARTQLALFQGANEPDFSDALPLYLTDQPGKIGEMSYADINCSKGFRYVRYVGPNNSRCNVAELQFYGHAGEGDLSQIYRPSSLPCILIHTFDHAEPLDKVNEHPALITVLYEGTTRVDTATIRCRGNASMDFPKKPYRIKFAKKQRILDATAKAKKWVLLSNYSDKSLMRNMVAFEYSRRFGMAYTPYCRPVDVFLNGEYKGCYQLADNLEIGKDRIDIDEMTSSDNAGLALTGGYHLEMDGYANQEPPQSYFYSSRYNAGITIKDPGDDVITSLQKSYIQSHYNSMEQAVAAAGGNWRQYLDETSFLHHFLIGELTGNTDTYWSMHMYKKRGNDTIFCGPEWDFDIAFDNDYRHYPVCDKSDYLYSYAGTNKIFVSRIVKSDQQALRAIMFLWSDARLNKGLTPDAICQKINDWAAEMEESQRLNFLRWPVLSQKVHMNPRTPGTYANEITFLKNFVRNRFQWMDQKIGIDQSVKNNTALENLSAENCGPIRIYTLQGLLLGEWEQMPDLPQGYYIIQQNKTTEIIWKEK